MGHSGQLPVQVAAQLMYFLSTFLLVKNQTIRAISRSGQLPVASLRYIFICIITSCTQIGPFGPLMYIKINKIYYCKQITRSGPVVLFEKKNEKKIAPIFGSGHYF